MTKTNKNGPEVMQQLQGQVASSTPAQPFAPPAQLAAPQPVVAPVHPAVPPAQPVAPPAQVALPEPAVAPPASAVGTMEELERLALSGGVGPKLPPVPAAQPDPGSAEPVTINWSTNKKEGMRLTRMKNHSVIPLTWPNFGMVTRRTGSCYQFYVVDFTFFFHPYRGLFFKTF